MSEQEEITEMNNNILKKEGKCHQTCNIYNNEHVNVFAMKL